MSSSIYSVLVAANECGERSRQETLAREINNPQRKLWGDLFFHNARAAYLQASLETAYRDAEFAREARLPKCTPGWQLMPAWIGEPRTGVRVWVEFQTAAEDEGRIAQLYHCHVPTAEGCRKVLIGEATPFSAEQIEAWEAEALAFASNGDTEPCTAEPGGFDADLAADAYQRGIDGQHHANHRGL